MSAGGVFKLIANDGKADRMIMATELLNKRIKDIVCYRARKRYPDPTPTLLDIERTHVLFVNAHFKPFAAIGYEYNKVRSGSGQTQYGGSVQYSIPQFGDFFHDMVVNARLAAASATTWTNSDIPAFPGFIGDIDDVVTNTSSVSAVSNNPVYTRYTYEYVTEDGSIVDRGAATGQNYVRYCEFPGQRLFKHVKFDVNGNPLDEYDTTVAMMHQKFHVAPGKQSGYKRLVGQEVPDVGYSDLCSIAGSSPFGSDHVGLTLQAGGTAPIAPVNASLTARKEVQVVHGPQTPKVSQPELDMWIPLHFWFNKDPRLSIASVSIPYGQRFITIELEAQDKIVYTAPGNLFLQLTTEVVTNVDGTSGGNTIVDYQRFQTREPVLVPNSTLNTSQGISAMDLYINNIFVNPEIHDIYIKRIGFSLIRVYRFQKTNQNTESGDQLLSNLKWPIETMWAGMRPKFNIANPVYNGLSVSSGNKNVWRDWHRFTRLNDNVCYEVAKSSSLLPTTQAVPTDTAYNNTAFQDSTVQSGRCVFPVETKTLTTVKITAHGIDIYKDYASEFFADYQPYHYGGYNVVTPEDKGALMINFCLYPGTYQPSGHINISRAREFYFAYTSAFVGVVDSNDPQGAVAEGELIVVASAINFLLISDGSAVLRYST